MSATGLSPSMADRSRSFAYVACWSLPDRGVSRSSSPPQPQLSNAYTLSRTTGLGSSRFARRYSGNRYCFLFLRVLRYFTSPGWPPHPMDSDADAAALPAAGFPIRAPPDQRL